METVGKGLPTCDGIGVRCIRVRWQDVEPSPTWP